MHHYLVVANRTLGGAALLDTVRDRMDRGPAAFWVLVPATPTSYLINDFNALSGAFPVDPSVAASAADRVAGRPDHDDAEAAARLDTALQRLRGLSATAEGAVGDPDPVKAVDAALADRAFDEILLSTLPAGISRWLALDLPRRLRRRTDVPLTVLTAGDEPAGAAPPPDRR